MPFTYSLVVVLSETDILIGVLASVKLKYSDVIVVSDVLIAELNEDSTVSEVMVESSTITDSDPATGMLRVTVSEMAVVSLLETVVTILSVIDSEVVVVSKTDILPYSSLPIISEVVVVSETLIDRMVIIPTNSLVTVVSETVIK